MPAAFTYYSDPVLPWSNTRNDERFSRVVKKVFIVFILLGLIIPWLPTPEIEKKTLKQVSPRLAKLITQKRKQKPAAPKFKTAKKKVTKKKVKKKKTTKKKKKKALKKAKQSGLMAMSKDIQDLQSMFDLSSLSSTKPLHNSQSKSKSTKRSVLSNRSSGGIDTSKLSRSTGNTGLKGRRTSRVSSNIGTTGTNTQRRRQTGANARGLEELTIIFDKYKGALQNIYQRALRKDPTLQGNVVFELTINASGKVIKCKIVSSDFNLKSLERRLVARVKLFRFPSRRVSTVTVTYPINFLPS